MNVVCFDTSDRVRLCYSVEMGIDASLPLLVFIPGWTMPAALWKRQLVFFAGRYPLIALDPRGQGESAVPAYGYTLERRAQDIKELLDRFPDRRFVLIGWSLAVLESLVYIRSYGDERLLGLVLVDNSIGEGSDAPPGAKENPFFAALRADRKTAVSNFVDLMFRHPPDAALRETILSSALKMPLEDSIRLLSQPRPRVFWREIIYRTSCPILYLVTPRWAGQARALAEKHSRAQAHVFEGSGHALFWDEAEHFNRVLDDFVAPR